VCLFASRGQTIILWNTDGLLQTHYEMDCNRLISCIFLTLSFMVSVCQRSSHATRHIYYDYNYHKYVCKCNKDHKTRAYVHNGDGKGNWICWVTRALLRSPHHPCGIRVTLDKYSQMLHRFVHVTIYTVVHYSEQHEDVEEGEGLHLATSKNYFTRYKY
jgi:hypothetical protein